MASAEPFVSKSKLLVLYAIDLMQITDFFLQKMSYASDTTYNELSRVPRYCNRCISLCHACSEKQIFSSDRLGFSVLHEDLSWVQQFGESDMWPSRCLYVAWRFLLAAVMMIGFGLELSGDIQSGVGPWYPIYLTNWSLFFENCYLNFSFGIALWIYVKSPDPASAQPWPTKPTWFFRSIAQQGAVVVTISYWAIDYDGILTLRTVWVHAINSAVVVLDVLTSRYEVRPQHICTALYAAAAAPDAQYATFEPLCGSNAASAP